MTAPDYATNRCPACHVHVLADGTPSHLPACPLKQAAQAHKDRVRLQNTMGILEALRGALKVKL